MDFGSLFIGSDISAVTQRCLEEVIVETPPAPEEVLIVGHNRGDHDRLTSIWDSQRPPIASTVTGLDDVITRWVEASEGPTEELDTITRRRLVEQALASVDREETALLDGDTKLVSPFSSLFTAFEEGGLTTTDALEDALLETAIPPDHADVLETAFGAFLNRQNEFLPVGIESQATHYEIATANPDAFSQAFPEVHTVILSGFYSLTDLQRRLIDSIPDGVTVQAVLPFPESVDDKETRPVWDSVISQTSNDLLTETLRTYRALGADPVVVESEGSEAERAAKQMYHPISEPVELGESVQWWERPTPKAEVETVVREIKTTLNDGTSPASFTVVVPGMLSYREFIIELFEAYEIPYAVQSNKTLGQTLAGSAVQTILGLSGPQSEATQLIDLVTNPLVDISHGSGSEQPLDIESIQRTVGATHDRATQTVVDQLDGETAEILTDLHSQCQRLSKLDPVDAVTHLRELMSDLGITSSVSDLSERDDPSFDTSMEVRAYESVQRQLESIVITEDAEISQSGRKAIQNALSSEMVSPPPQSTDNAVEIIGLRDTGGRTFESTFLLGALDEHLPSRSETPAFFDRLYETVDQLKGDDELSHDRYLTRLLVANSDSLLITTPKETIDGEPLLQSEILTELARVSDLTANESPDNRIATSIECHHAIAARENPSSEAERAHAAGALSTAEYERIVAGTRTAAARVSAEPNAHNGLIDSEIVDQLDRFNPNEPISPSRLNTYASCGFRYFAGHGLGLDEPDTIDPLPDASALGTLIHEVLRELFERLQTTPGTPVELEDADRPDIERTVLDAAQHVIQTATHHSLEQFDWGTKTAFARHQLEELFAGIGSDEINPYYNTEYPHSGSDRGMFARFLDIECGSKATAVRFEYPFGGLQEDSDHVEITTPRGKIQLRGQIDRVDRSIPEDGPDEVTVWDYKSGSAPSKLRTAEGTDFQLATYLRAAGESLDGEITLNDGRYYEVSPPNGVNQKRGIRNAFDSRAAFDAFLDVEFPARLGQLKTGIEQGAFQPTYLDADAAGCEYCPYRSACDVRHHRDMNESAASPRTQFNIFPRECSKAVHSCMLPAQTLSRRRIPNDNRRS